VFLSVYIYFLSINIYWVPISRTVLIRTKKMKRDRQVEGGNTISLASPPLLIVTARSSIPIAICCVLVVSLVALAGC